MSQALPTVRRAEIADIPAIQAIYAYHVLYGTGTFEETPPSVEQMAARFSADQTSGWLWVVSEDASGICGYAYFRQLRDRSAYRFAAENSVYVRENVRGQGVGKALLSQLLDDATAQGFTQMIAIIGDSENTGSIGVHSSLGFHKVGLLRRVGFKAGQWLDCVYMQKSLETD